MRRKLAIITLLLTVATPAQAGNLLYSQDFENPTGFVNDGGDINIYRSINQLYGGQPVGFQFAQTFTTETLLVGGTQAFDTGYVDPAGTAGNYVLGQLSSTQNDLLGLAFNVGSFRYLNFQMDISSIDLDRFGGPFVSAGGAAPEFRFSLFDNPLGTTNVGTGTLLDSFTASALFNPSKNSFLWSTVTSGLDASTSTNGNVVFQIDVLNGGYGAFDNLSVSADDIIAPPPTGAIPEPATWAMMLLGFFSMGMVVRRRSASSRAIVTA